MTSNSSAAIDKIANVCKEIVHRELK